MTAVIKSTESDVRNPTAVCKASGRSPFHRLPGAVREERYGGTTLAPFVTQQRSQYEGPAISLFDWAKGANRNGIIATITP